MCASPDSSVKYLGLLGMLNILKVHPSMLSDMKDTVLACLDDEDKTIRKRALELLSGMVSLWLHCPRIILFSTRVAGFGGDPDTESDLLCEYFGSAKASRRSLRDLVARLMKYLKMSTTDVDFRNDLMEAIVAMCSAETYQVPYRYVPVF